MRSHCLIQICHDLETDPAAGTVLIRLSRLRDLADGCCAACHVICVFGRSFGEVLLFYFE
jgi:hypothetical protein